MLSQFDRPAMRTLALRSDLDGSKEIRQSLLEIYQRLAHRYGPQRWWPGETAFEIMVGAVLTQAAAWVNVEKAITNLKAASALSPQAIRRIPEERLAALLYPTVYYNVKARKLKALAEFLGRWFDDDLDAMSQENAGSLREELLGVYGIGEETADDILLYVSGQPVFVVDSYTRRIFARLGLAPQKGMYSEYQGLFTRHLPADPGLYGEYHALIVRHGREVCRKRPECAGCCLLEVCPTGKGIVRGEEA